MTIDPATIREEALSLPTEARARLVAELLQSLDDEEEVSPADHDAAWRAEIAERLRSVDAGEIKPVSWAEARERIAREEYSLELVVHPAAEAEGREAWLRYRASGPAVAARFLRRDRASAVPTGILATPREGAVSVTPRRTAP